VIEPSPDRPRFLAGRPVGCGEKPEELVVVENCLEKVRAKVKRKSRLLPLSGYFLLNDATVIS